MYTLTYGNKTYTIKEKRITISYKEALYYYNKIRGDGKPYVRGSKELAEIMGWGRSGKAIPESLLLPEHRKFFQEYLDWERKMEPPEKGWPEPHLCFTCWKEEYPPVFEIGKF